MDIEIQHDLRIVAEIEPELLLNDVFPIAADQKKFLEVLKELNIDSRLQIGGRTLRRVLGFTGYDFSREVVKDAKRLRVHDNIRLASLVDILKLYPEERMSMPDLDFFIWGEQANEIVDVLKNNGFDPQLHEATGSVKVVTIETNNGIVSFVNGQDSWQTRNPWPKYATLAKFVTSPEPHFKVDVSKDELVSNPLELHGINDTDKLDPHRLAAIGRSLLWMVTEQTPHKKELSLPSVTTRNAIFESMLYLYPLVEKLENNPEFKVFYRGAIRDMSLALRVILVSDWSAMAKEGYPADRTAFFMDIAWAWRHGMFTTMRDNNYRDRWGTTIEPIGDNGVLVYRSRGEDSGDGIVYTQVWGSQFSIFNQKK